MKPSRPVTIRRHQIAYGRYRKTGWRWQCNLCPPIRGRPRHGFHRDNRWTDWRNPGRYPKAFPRCVQAAITHLHIHHGGPAPLHTRGPA